MKKTLMKLLSLLMCAAVAFGVNACHDDDDDNKKDEFVPTTIDVKSVSPIAETSITVSVEISGNDAIISRGIYISTNAITPKDYEKLTPTTAKEAGTGEFEVSFNNLLRDTEYHFVAFA